MYREFLKFVAQCVVEVICLTAIAVVVIALLFGLASGSRGALPERQPGLPESHYRIAAPPDRIRFIHSDPFSSRTFELKATVSMLIRRGEWRGVDVTVYNTSHFYWWPADDFDCPYILVNAVRNSRGFYEIDSIEDHSGDKIKPISLRKPEAKE
jgi:hypothetical protein